MPLPTPDMIREIAQSPRATTQFLLLYRHLWPDEFLELIRQGDIAGPILTDPAGVAKTESRLSVPPATN